MKIALDLLNQRSCICDLNSVVIKNEDDLLKIENFIKETEIVDYTLHPLYDMNNLNFFKENVYTTRNEMLENKQSQLE